MPHLHRPSQVKSECDMGRWGMGDAVDVEGGVPWLIKQAASRMLDECFVLFVDVRLANEPPPF